MKARVEDFRVEESSKVPAFDEKEVHRRKGDYDELGD